MTNTENNLLDLLLDLKQNHHIIGIKTEFEDEGASFEEAFYLNQLAKQLNLDFTIKIGGCGALNDMNQAKKLNTDAIVAPMVESPYAVRKFVQSIESIYFDSVKKPNLFINIETINGFNCFDEIQKIEAFEKISGVIVGRFDLAKSIGLSCKDCDGEQIFRIVEILAQKVRSANKLFIIGGGIKTTSLDFFKNLKTQIDNFETRKIIFDANFSIENNDIKGIINAIDFEMAWISEKQNLYGTVNSKDAIRLQKLKERTKIENQDTLNI